MKLYYCTNCQRYYYPDENGGTGPYLSAEEALAVTLAGHDCNHIRCDPCLDNAVKSPAGRIEIKAAVSRVRSTRIVE